MNRSTLALVLSAAWLMAWTPALAQVDYAKTFFTPQAGDDYNNPITGAAALQYFRICPNNDADGSLPLKARIMVQVLDGSNNGVSLPASEIYMKFNGGTPAQGFFGDGADSIIANTTFNPAAGCPLVQTVYADGPTDPVTGITYITFTGPAGVRDSGRKWGHYDENIPVFVQGIQVSGRMTANDPGTPYKLRIKNFDYVGGLGTTPNQGELVNTLDLNAFLATLGGTGGVLKYWQDFDTDGIPYLSDYNMLYWHVNHDCDTPTY